MRIPLLLTALLSLVLFTACSSVSYNPTVFDYFIAKDELKKTPVKKVIIASVNVTGEPTRSILRDSVPKIDGMVIDYLKSNGYEIAPQHLFNNAWQQALLNYGDFYDPTTGKVDTVGWQRVMATTFQSLQEHKDIDAVLFTDVIAHDVQHSSSMKHYARWYGVTREPATEGASSSVPIDFNWTQIIKGASLVITMYATDGRPLFASRGGMDTLHAIDTRKSQKGFVRRKKILSNSSRIEEGIELAFHPLIKMSGYPGPEKPEKKDKSQ
ncbi:MAG: hypothetical protein ACPHN3_02105 [Spongiibacter sp.]|uniref:Lipoprotein n=1 Tax=Spongiibacter thalassae TaxID=2721624 RepID=A0ABX1GD61_9GAMM|nr:hypothetical protein [Spongiibacter thalassae]NKI17120.1 hypothetical protein [Spongiibacter thalassae]